MTLCNYNDQTWFSDTITSARPPVGHDSRRGDSNKLGRGRFADDLSFFLNIPINMK